MFTFAKKSNMDIPEIIEGIPTDKGASAQRREIIRQTYMRLFQHLQQTKGKKAAFNDFLSVDVYIIMRESEQKTSNSGAHNRQSTYAVKHLEKVIKNAKAQDENKKTKPSCNKVAKTFVLACTR